MLMWGLTQWLFATPLLVWWKAGGKRLSANWLLGTSAVCSLFSVVLLGMAIFGRLLNLYRDWKYR
jgi:hypothetical protein